ncbi:MAG TPA: class I tRNA ligase family protein, partial [Kofleriaceae bacterium]
ALQAVRDGETVILPDEWRKTYDHFLGSIQDWCVSRQLWWGHQIPAWHNRDTGEVVVARERPARCAGEAWTQDADVLDTWFSSALWPFSTLGWPEQTAALAKFYGAPSSDLETGYDILFFWVARMMMMGLHFMGKVPFRTVYLTSTVTDETGAKMSKMKGNTIDPLDVVHGATLDAMLERATRDNVPDEAVRNLKKLFAKGISPMGADALRFALAALNTSGRYIRLSIDRVEGYRNFINKLWNASRFALMNLDGYDPERFAAQQNLFELPERWIMSRLAATVGAVDAALEAFRFADAANALYHFVWHELCDWYIELAKPNLYHADVLDQDQERNALRHRTQGVLASTLETTMRLMHPFTPYVSEEIWQKLPKPTQLPASLMITVFPKATERDAEAESEMETIQEVVRNCRMMKQTYGISPAQTVKVAINATTHQALLERYKAFVERMARVDASFGPWQHGSARVVISSGLEVSMPIEGLVDPTVEKGRISKDLAKAEKEVGGLEKKLGNADFVARAPEDVVAEQRERLVEEQARCQRLRDAIATLEAL